MLYIFLSFTVWRDLRLANRRIRNGFPATKSWKTSVIAVSMHTLCSWVLRTASHARRHVCPVSTIADFSRSLAIH